MPGILFDANILIYLASDDATTKVRLNASTVLDRGDV